MNDSRIRAVTGCNDCPLCDTEWEVCNLTEVRTAHYTLEGGNPHDCPLASGPVTVALSLYVDRVRGEGES